MSYKTLLVELEDGVLTVTLNRPEVHNAFNDELIAEAIDLFSNIDVEAARIVVLKGTGKNFCAGADLNWMSRMVSYTREENVRDSSLLAKMYALINECPLPVVGRIQGAAIGGGVGLVSVCDVAIAMTMTCIFPSETPCGWHLIGRCPVPLWNPRTGGAMALLRPGDKVGFAPVSLHEYEGLLAQAADGQLTVTPCDDIRDAAA